MPEVVAFAAQSDVETAVCDLCAYVMKVRDGEGEAYARKSTRLVSNAHKVLKRLRKTCSNRDIPDAQRRMAKPMPRAAKSMAIVHGVCGAIGVRTDELAGETTGSTIFGGVATH